MRESRTQFGKLLITISQSGTSFVRFNVKSTWLEIDCDNIKVMKTKLIWL